MHSHEAKGAEQSHHFLSLWQFLSKHRESSERCVHKGEQHMKSAAPFNTVVENYSILPFFLSFPCLCSGDLLYFAQAPRVKIYFVCPYMGFRSPITFRSAKKGNSKMDGMLSHNMHRLHRCYKLFVWRKQSLFLFLLFLSTPERKCRLPSAKFGLNSKSLSSLLCQSSKFFPHENPLALKRGNMCTLVNVKVIFLSNNEK